MRFFTAQFEYYEIRYDNRTRLEVICRKSNDETWGEKSQSIYFAVNEVTYERISCVWAVPDSRTSDEEMAQYVREIMDNIEAKGELQAIYDKEIKMKEVTMNAFRTLINDNASGKLFLDKMILFGEIGINPKQKCYREYLLDTEFWNKENHEFEYGFLQKAEQRRIKCGRGCAKPVIQPVHYVIHEEESQTAEKMVKELLHHLCVKGRICNRRIVRIDISDWIDITESKKIQNLNHLDGGTVVLLLEKNDDAKDCERLLKAIYSVENGYSEKYTAIIVCSREREEISRWLKNILPQWAFVDIYNETLTEKKAIAYLDSLATKDKIAKEDRMWKEILDKEGTYTYAEVLKLYKMWYRNTYNVRKYFPQYKETIEDYFQNKKEDRNARVELDRLVGLENVKTVVNEIVDFFKLQQIRSTINPDISKPTMHMVFYGNPGTAKTTVARLLGRILKEEKILDVGEFFEVGRSDLVGKYVGWTAKIVKECFEKAKGSVLFIDEAYALVDGDNSFGDEAINTIVQEMENHRHDVLVILAGYRQDMEELIQKNRGMESRIAFYIDFPDYSAEELYQILEKMVADEKLCIDSDVKNVLMERLSAMNVSRGNGRLVRNLLDQAKLKQAGRVLALPKEKRQSEMMLLKAADF